MEMNEITREKIANKLIAAITDEKLLNKDVAVKFETDAASMSHLKRPDNYHKIPVRVWDNFRKWHYSGEPLSKFELLLEIEKETPEISPELTAEEMTIVQTAGSKYQEVSSAPYPEKKDIAAKMRKKFEDDKKQADKKLAKKYKAEARAATKQMREEYEKAHHPESVMLKDGSKVDLSKIDFRTGSIITIEAYADHTTITIKHPDK